MGFFQKKRRADEIQEHVDKVLATMFGKCPICKIGNFYIMDKMVKYNTITDMTSYTNGTVGFCGRCGFVAHGHVFCKEPDKETNINFCNFSLLILKQLDEKNMKIMNMEDVDLDERIRLLNENHVKFINDIKNNNPEYSSKVDFEYFIKLCIEFKYNIKF